MTRKHRHIMDMATLPSDPFPLPSDHSVALIPFPCPQTLLSLPLRPSSPCPSDHYLALSHFSCPSDPSLVPQTPLLPLRPFSSPLRPLCCPHTLPLPSDHYLALSPFSCPSDPSLALRPFSCPQTLFLSPQTTLLPSYPSLALRPFSCPSDPSLAPQTLLSLPLRPSSPCPSDPPLLAPQTLLLPLRPFSCPSDPSLAPQTLLLPLRPFSYPSDPPLLAPQTLLSLPLRPSFPVSQTIPLTGNLLQNFCPCDALVNIARVAFIVGVITTFPLECFVCRDVRSDKPFDNANFKESTVKIATFPFRFLKELSKVTYFLQIIQTTFFKGYEPSEIRHAIITVLLVVSVTAISLITDRLGLIMEVVEGLK